nr:hypothetical protein [Zygogramma bicolorata]
MFEDENKFIGQSLVIIIIAKYFNSEGYKVKKVYDLKWELILGSTCAVKIVFNIAKGKLSYSIPNFNCVPAPPTIEYVAGRPFEQSRVSDYTFKGSGYKNVNIPYRLKLLDDTSKLLNISEKIDELEFDIPEDLDIKEGKEESEEKESDDEDESEYN